MNRWSHSTLTDRVATFFGGCVSGAERRLRSDRHECLPRNSGNCARKCDADYQLMLGLALGLKECKKSSYSLLDKSCSSSGKFVQLCRHEWSGNRR